MTNATRAQVLQHLETLETDPAVLEALRASEPAGAEAEAAADAVLDLVLLPPIRVDRATHAALQEAAKAGGKVLQAVVRERLAPYAMPAISLPPVEGDILPAVGSKVLIHLASQDAWVEHTVAGYYVWPNHGLAPRVFRVFVRVRDADGYLNARSLEDIRYPETASPAPAAA